MVDDEEAADRNTPPAGPEASAEPTDSAERADTVGSADSVGSGARSVLRAPRSERLTVVFGLPAAGLLLGLVLPAVARGAIELPGPLPFGAVFRGLAAVDAPWEMALGALAGLVLGTVLALTSLGESTTVTVTDAELRLDRDSYHGAVRRAEVAAVFLDGRTLVVLDPGSRQLVRERCPAPAAQVAAGLRAHGYPWRDADPYADRYRRWVPESPQLPPAVGALLAARRTALGKKAHREVRELRAAVEELGYTVRDEDGAQYWRSLEPVD